MVKQQRDFQVELKHQDICEYYEEVYKEAQKSIVLPDTQRVDENGVRQIVADKFRCSTAHVRRVWSAHYKNKYKR